MKTPKFEDVSKEAEYPDYYDEEPRFHLTIPLILISMLGLTIGIVIAIIVNYGDAIDKFFTI